jgi:hypothetical protein
VKTKRLALNTAFTRVDTFPEEGWYLLAYFRTTRARIMQAFGPPDKPSQASIEWGKTSSEWTLKTPRGEIVSIYDWREDYTESGWKHRKYIASNECQQHNHIEMQWHIGGVQPTAAEEIGEALGVPLSDLERYNEPKPPEPPYGMREHETATRRLAEIVEPDGLATGIFKLPVGDRNPVTLGVNEDDYRRVIETPYKGTVDVSERPSGRHRLLRWADYGKSGVVGLIFVDGEDDLTGQMYPILWEVEAGVQNPQR